MGVLPYPITFLCTDIISELYGRKRASNVVWVGFGLNIWVAFILWLGGVLPPELPIDAATGLPPEGTDGRLFFQVQHLAFGSVVASMGAYLLAQLCDVHLFHFWKRLTGGAHLWLRNNASTMVSQFVDSFAVMTITHFYAKGLPLDETMPLWPQLWTFILAGYVFKLVCAALDTVRSSLLTLVRWLSEVLEVDPTQT